MQMLIRLLLLLVLTSGPCMATTYYVDCGAAPGGDGSYATPWDSVSGVRGLNTSDDVYFKEDVTCTTSSYWYLDWGGTSDDAAIIGCYNGDGKFACDSGSGKAILDGGVAESDWYDNSASGHTIIHTNQKNYVTIQDLQLQNTFFHAIHVEQSNNITVRRCKMEFMGSAGVADPNKNSDNLKVEYCEVTKAGLRDKYGFCKGCWPAAIYSRSDGAVIQYNYVHDTWTEGVNCHINSSNCTLQYNLVGATYSFGVYFSGAGSNKVAKYNLVYGEESNTGCSNNPNTRQSSGHDCWQNKYLGKRYWNRGMGIDCESGSGAVDMTFFGNIVIGNGYGISLACSVASTQAPKNVKVYNNTFIDNYYNIFVGSTDDRFVEVKIINNLSDCDSGTACEHGHESGDGVLDSEWYFSNNYYSDNDFGTFDDGNWDDLDKNVKDCFSNSPYDAPNWQSLARDMITPAKEFRTENTFNKPGNVCIDAGLHLEEASYENLLVARIPTPPDHDIPTDFMKLMLISGEKRFTTGNQDKEGLAWDIGAFLLLPQPEGGPPPKEKPKQPIAAPKGFTKKNTKEN